MSEPNVILQQAYAMACRERDDARADVERLTKEREEARAEKPSKAVFNPRECVVCCRPWTLTVADNTRHLETIRALRAAIGRYVDADGSMSISETIGAALDASREYEQADDVKGELAIERAHTAALEQNETHWIGEVDKARIALEAHVALVRRLDLAVRYFRDEQCGVKAFASEVVEVMSIFAVDPGAFAEDEKGDQTTVKVDAYSRTHHGHKVRDAAVAAARHVLNCRMNLEDVDLDAEAWAAATEVLDDVKGGG